MTIFLAITLLWSLTASPLPKPSGDEILRRVDRNVTSGNRVFSAEMVIHGRRGKRTVASKSWVSGRDKAFTEYLAPARERGTKMLKLADQLWTYTPATDRIIRISGHMLRQSLMGSDLSYEDMMEDQELHRLYTAEIVADTTFLARACWILQLSARESDVTYHTRKIWVDKERYLPLKEERFAKSGKLLKMTEVRAMQKIDNRWVMTHGVFRDALKSDSKGTEFFIAAIEFDVDIPEHVFSKAALRR
jgi:outer membrane lipoprotein-sorting protein